jgi:hypothetical protein
MFVNFMIPLVGEHSLTKSWPPSLLYVLQHTQHSRNKPTHACRQREGKYKLSRRETQPSRAGDNEQNILARAVLKLGIFFDFYITAKCYSFNQLRSKTDILFEDLYLLGYNAVYSWRYDRIIRIIHLLLIFKALLNNSFDLLYSLSRIKIVCTL